MCLRLFDLTENLFLSVQRVEHYYLHSYQNKLTHVDLTTVHLELQQIKDKCDSFLKNLHRAGAIDDSMLFHVTGLKEREQKYHKCSGNSAKYFSDLVTAYAYPLFKTHKLDQESLLSANITNIPVRLLQCAGHITTSRFTAFLEHLLQPVSVEFCKSTINEFCKDSKHYLQDLCEWKKNHNTQTLETMTRFIWLLLTSVLCIPVLKERR